MYTSTMTGIYPLRCGILAASSVNHTRQETGAGYMGVMELSGNMSERVVHIGRSQPLIHRLHATGSWMPPFANVSSGRGSTGTLVICCEYCYATTDAQPLQVRPERRGKRFFKQQSRTQTGNRRYTNYYSNHDSNKGGRYVRTAP